MAEFYTQFLYFFGDMATCFDTDCRMAGGFANA